MNNMINKRWDKFNVNSVKFNFNSMKFNVSSMKFNVNSISIQLEFNEFQCHFNQLTAKHHGSCKASYILHTEITLFQLFSLFAGKMEKQLRSLAAFLGECSRIVSQVLDSSDSSSNGNMTLAWNSSDCFESFSPLNNVWIDRPLTPSSDVTHYPKTG